MEAYTTIDGETIDLSALSDEHRDALAAAFVAYRAGMAFAAFGDEFVSGTANPLTRETGGWVTPAVWHHPLYRALRDLGDRLGIAQGRLAPEGDWRSNPLAGQQPSMSEVARRSS